MALFIDASALMRIANDHSFADAFARQVLGLGRESDCLVVTSTLGNPRNLVAAVKADRTGFTTSLAMQLEHLHPPPRSTNLATPGFLFMNGTAEGGRSLRANEVKRLRGSNACLKALLPDWEPRAIRQTLSWMLESASLAT